MIELPITLDNQNLENIFGKIALLEERIILQQEGMPVAAIVPIEDLEVLEELEELEDELDLEAAQEALKEPGTVSWEQVKANLGL